MFNLETAIRAWMRQYSFREPYTDADRKEIERHIRDHVTALVEAGCREEDAFRRATRAFGPAHESDDEYEKVFWRKRDAGHPVRAQVMHGLAMMRHHASVSVRAMMRHADSTAISIVGLAAGLATSFLIFLFVSLETGYDAFHPDSERLYRVLVDAGDGSLRARSQFILSEFASDEIAGIESMVRLSWDRSAMVAVGSDVWSETGVFAADSSFADVFGFRIVSGDPERMLDDPDGVVVTETLARKIFGTTDALGRSLTIDAGRSLYVAAVAADPPRRSHLRFSLLTPMPEYAANWGEGLTDWSTTEIHTYLKTATDADPGAIEEQLARLASRRGGFESGSVPRYVLQPITDIHLHSASVTRDIQPQGNLQIMRMFSALAVLILIIAAVNYVNLATARSTGRARETGLRKTVGASRRQLLVQYLMESVIIASVAVAVAALIAILGVDTASRLTGTALDIGDVLHSLWILAVAGLVIGIAAGLYPAVLQSSWSASVVLRGPIPGSGNAYLRNGLVTFQLLVSSVLIFGAVVLFRQMDFIQSVDPGFETSDRIVVRIPGHIISGNDAYRSAVADHPGILSITGTSNIPPESWGAPIFTPAGIDTALVAKLYAVDFNYLDIMDMDLVAGRDFRPDSPGDSTAFILNESAVRAMSLSPESVLGLRAHLSWVDREGVVIGVVEDFHFRSLHSPITPAVLTIEPDMFWKLIVRTEPGAGPDVVEHLEARWKELSPGWVFDYSYLDDQMRAIYSEDRRLGRLIGYLTMLVTTLACFGLYGLVSFSTRRRTKEIGIRKAMGASTMSLLGLLSSSYVRLLAISVVLAIPAAWILSSRWLDGFAYSIELGPGIVVRAVGLAALVTGLTIAGHIVGAARKDPVECLRFE